MRLPPAQAVFALSLAGFAVLNGPLSAQAPAGGDPLGAADWLTTPARSHPLAASSWLWVAPPGAPPPTPAAAPAGEVRLHADLRLSGARPAAATLWLAADNFARVAVNGHPAGESRDWSVPVALDVGPFLRAGSNLFEVLARNDPGAEGATNPAGLLAALEVVHAGGVRSTLTLDWQSPDGAVVSLGPSSIQPWSFRPPSGPCPLFRREFEVSGDVLSARARVVGLGHFQLRVNGRRAGEDWAYQPWSQYDRRIYYEEFDLAPLLEPGPNALGVLLGNGFWRVATPPPGSWSKGDAMPDFSDGRDFLLRLRLEIRYRGGRVQVVDTDPDWRVHDGPLVFSHIYAGEDWDARLWPAGWDRPGFGDEDWQAPVAARPPAARLSPRDFPGLRTHEVQVPVTIREPAPGTWSYLFSRNAAAVLRFRVRGPAGATVEFLPSEVLDEEGFVRQLNLHGRRAVFRYTLRGGGEEEHQWLFHYHGFQYVQVRGAVPAGRPNPDGLPVLESLELVEVHAANPVAGSFACSSALYRDIHALVDQAMRSNMSWVLTDCPHREKLGWLECAHLLARSFLYRYDCAPWFRKIARDIGDAQLPSGRILTVAPRYLLRDEDDPYAWTVEWGAAGVLLPWQLYEWTGDATVLREHYGTMRRFVDHVASLSPDGIAPGALGDWYDYGHGRPPGPSRFTPPELTATACQAMCVRAVAEAAGVLGRPEDEARYRRLYGSVRAAFLDRFYDPATHRFENHGSPQTANAMALCAGLVPESDRAAVLQAILDDLEARDWQQTSGDVGHLFFIRALAAAGRSDVLHRVYSRTGTGSYGGILAKGLTSMPETWDALTVGSNSLNHCMLGHVMEWFPGWVLGVRQPEGSVGWREILVAPEPGELTWCRGRVPAPLGPVDCSWERREDTFLLEVTIPDGARARLILPPECSLDLDVDGEPRRAGPGLFGRPAVGVGPGRHVVLAPWR